MKFDKKQVMNNLQSTGLTVCGVAGTYAASKLPFIPQGVRKFVPYAALAGGILIPALSKSQHVKSLASGMAVYGALATVSSLTKDASGNVATTGIKAMVANYVPQLGEAPSIGQNLVYNEDSIPQLMGYENEEEEYETAAYPTLAGQDQGLLM